MSMKAVDMPNNVWLFLNTAFAIKIDTEEEWQKLREFIKNLGIVLINEAQLECNGYESDFPYWVIKRKFYSYETGKEDEYQMISHSNTTVLGYEYKIEDVFPLDYLTEATRKRKEDMQKRKGEWNMSMKTATLSENMYAFLNGNLAVKIDTEEEYQLLRKLLKENEVTLANEDIWKENGYDADYSYLFMLSKEDKFYMGAETSMVCLDLYYAIKNVISLEELDVER